MAKGDIIEVHRGGRLANVLSADDADRTFIEMTQLVDENGDPASLSLEGADIEIGAVELKDGLTDTRAEIGADLRLSVNANQQIGDADVSILNPLPVDATGQGNIPVDVTTSNGAGATIGETTDAAVVTDANGTIQQYLRGIVSLIVAKIGITIADGDDTTLGVTTGAKVITDASGTVQQYLRGIVHLLISIITVKIDQTTPGSTNKVVTDPATTTQTDYNITLTNADTEYSQALPANCRLFEFQCRTDVALRWSKTTGKVAGPAAPYKTLKAGDFYYSPPINQGAAPDTLYFAAAVGSLVVELTAWS